MPYIYKYIDKKDGKVKYVGLIRSESNFPRRFEQHKRDSWYNDSTWEIQYSEVKTVSDAEVLEGHFIAEYGTTEYYNKAKANWGECSFAPMVTWQKWDGETKNRCGIHNPQDKLVDIEFRVKDIRRETEKLLSAAYNSMSEVTRQKRSSARAWFRKTFTIVPYTMRDLSKCYSLDGAFESYNQYFDKYYGDAIVTNRGWSYELYEFETEDEFLSALYDCSDLSPYVRADCVGGVVLRDSEDEKKITAAEHVIIDNAFAKFSYGLEGSHESD